MAENSYHHKTTMDYIIGAYTSAPSIWKNEKKIEEEFYDLLKRQIKNIKGLEIPFFGDKIHSFGDQFIIDQLEDCWMNVITTVPASFNMLKSNIHFGLASKTDDARKLALKQHLKLSDIVRKINDSIGKKAVSHIQICSSPAQIKNQALSSKDSFRRSIEELLMYDWDDAKILIEHCDTPKANQRYQKGFLALQEEIEILDKLMDMRLGILLNWGRSVIEGRNTSEAIRHIEITQKKEYLKGFIFSGTAMEDTNYGEWSDLHMPFQNRSNPKFSFENSLLTEKNVKSTVASLDIDHIDYLGVKLHPLPHDIFPVNERVKINKDALLILEDSLSLQT